MLFRRQREPGWMAIRIEDGRIDLAYVLPGKPPAVLRCESFQQAGGPAESLRRLRKALKLERYRCTTLLDVSEYQMHQVEAPSVPQAEVRLALRWTIKDLIDYPIDAATVDVLEIPNSGSAGRARALLAISARNAAIAKRAELFDTAGVPLDAIDIAELAQRNVAICCETANRAVAVLAFHVGGGMLTISGNAELLVSRRIEIALERLIEAEPEQRSQYLDRIALEVQRSLDNFDRQFSFITLSRLMLAFVPAETGLKETLQANLDVPVEDLDLAQVLDLARVPELSGRQRQAQSLLVIGAALRSDHVPLADRAAA